MQSILTIILIEEMLKLSINYLNYEKVIRIDVKSNSEDNNDLYVHIISEIDLINYRLIEHPWMKQRCFFIIYKSKGYECLKSDQLVEKLLDCLVKNEIKASDLFDNKLIQSYHQTYGYYIEHGIDNSSMVNSYHFNHFMGSWCEMKLNLYNSFKLRKNLVEQTSENNSVIFKILIYKWFILFNLKSDLTLSSYNTMNSYEISDRSKNIWLVNQDLLFKKVLHKYLKPPHGMCDDYDNEDNRPFNATNQWHCYRQCLKSFGQKQFKCKPV